MDDGPSVSQNSPARQVKAGNKIPPATYVNAPLSLGKVPSWLFVVSCRLPEFTREYTTLLIQIQGLLHWTEPMRVRPSYIRSLDLAAPFSLAAVRKARKEAEEAKKKADEDAKIARKEKRKAKQKKLEEDLKNHQDMMDQATARAEEADRKKLEDLKTAITRQNTIPPNDGNGATPAPLPGVGAWAASTGS